VRSLRRVGLTVFGRWAQMVRGEAD
jgi:hypothetical protein